MIWHLLFCGADQDNQCMWDWEEWSWVSATTWESNSYLKCVSLQSECGFCKWPIKTGFIVFSCPCTVFYKNVEYAFSWQLQMNSNNESIPGLTFCWKCFSNAGVYEWIFVCRSLALQAASKQNCIFIAHFIPPCPWKHANDNMIMHPKLKRILKCTLNQKQSIKLLDSFIDFAVMLC